MPPWEGAPGCEPLPCRAVAPHAVRSCFSMRTWRRASGIFGQSHPGKQNDNVGLNMVQRRNGNNGQLAVTPRKLRANAGDRDKGLKREDSLTEPVHNVKTSNHFN